MSKFIIFCGALSAALSVILGAFAAHILKSRMPPETLAVFQTGVQYQFYHSLGMILIGLIVQFTKTSVLLTSAGWLMLTGMLLFSGSLYLISFSGLRSFGLITPVGGTAFIVAWLLLAFGILRT